MSAIQFPPFMPGHTGSFEAKIFDPTGEPADVVTNASGFTVECDWYIEGPLAMILPGKWRLQVAYEPIGAGVAGVQDSNPVKTDILPAPPAPPGHPLRVMASDTVDFPAGTLQLGTDPQRVYHLTALLSTRNAGDTAPGLYAAYYDLGIVQVVA